MADRFDEKARALVVSFGPLHEAAAAGAMREVHAEQAERIATLEAERDAVRAALEWIAHTETGCIEAARIFCHDVPDRCEQVLHDGTGPSIAAALIAAHKGAGK